MTIEIHKPELEAFIVQRMKSGGFHNVEDALLQALKMSPPVEEPLHEKRTGADLIAALQASPYRELDIEPPNVRLPSAEPKNLVELFAPLRGQFTDEEVDTLFSRNRSTARPLDLA
jgi:hypothetical protein